jgi:hypothetical protein
MRSHRIIQLICANKRCGGEKSQSTVRTKYKTCYLKRQGERGREEGRENKEKPSEIKSASEKLQSWRSGRM